ncbi:hypothetical protein [Idiomarina piscisalsi]|uniref:hypothetical protein n=1 Tax=Idiomarina piscisalsi TaxID=1096243 RepID=UPI00137CEF85|nr:hypothetical protein [Idiomarina piscisalsi]MTJ02270.1 hypothetical protein [Idiomarina piscisalsi]
MKDLTEFKGEVIRDLQLLCKKQNSEGSFTAGKNGPYGDQETPVRNTAHLLFAFCKAFEDTGDEIFKETASRALDYILNCQHKLNNGAYHCRISETKDATNGVIGNAWVIEALSKAYRTLSRDDALDEAFKLWRLHEFDYDLGIWAKPTVGSKRVFDNTFNHQLWFAACISGLSNEESKKQIERFLALNLSRVELYNDGVIYHKSFLGSYKNWVKYDIRLGVRKFLSKIKYFEYKKNFRLKSVGYHAFNLYAMAMLAENGYKDYIKSLIDIPKLLAAAESDSFLKELESVENIGLAYNLSGAELAYSYKVFYPEEATIVKWLEYQQSRTGYVSGFIFKNSPDSPTSDARLYELTRIFSG